MATETAIPGLSAELTSQLREELAKHPAISKAILFGSRAKGNFRPNSDIDLCLIAPELSFSEYLQVADAIDEILFPYSVDLILAHQVENPDVMEHIERIGVIVFSAFP
ncbi:nucleotidyltransferase domain-containing protein [Desulfurispirillum indicum]|uniref:nucleotidyltransferase domain-containing protein n=1 Tax=Desulfurispirillum indicum TaxID=936456 RepID=UPI001CFB402F|nr:nucleotidyltransferase domain-containing protein [Desulfurispirillum indicum]UCZ56925.1 nucleotidyltransferase domain-containing protein [Desulfurispirillum indicum]